jgi:acetoin utilization deacetylase AcuC-like enzyme
MAPTAATKAASNRARANPSAPKADPVKPEKKETVQQLKNRLRNEAEREVLDKYKPEVIKRTAAKYEAHGLEYVRRLTDEEKAQKEIEEHFKRYPNLRHQFVQPEQPERPEDEVQEGVGYPFTEGYEPVTRETIETGPEFDGQ